MLNMVMGLGFADSAARSVERKARRVGPIVDGIACGSKLHSGNLQQVLWVLPFVFAPFLVVALLSSSPHLPIPRLEGLAFDQTELLLELLRNVSVMDEVCMP